MVPSSEAPPTLKDSLLSQVGELQPISNTRETIRICIHYKIYTLYSVYIFDRGYQYLTKWQTIHRYPQLMEGRRIKKQLSSIIYFFTVSEALECMFFLAMLFDALN